MLFADHRHDETIAGMADRLLANAPLRFNLVGHAMGGFVAFEVMRRAPERVTRLVLIATLAAADGQAQTARRQGYIELVESGRFDQVVEERIPILFPQARRSDARMLGIVRKMAADTGAETFLRQQRAIMTRIDSRPTLGDIAVPTLLLRGEEDGITTDARQQEMRAAIPGARLLTLPGAGHLPTLEVPETLLPVLAEFLGSGLITTR